MSAEGRSLPTDLLLKVEGRITNAARLSQQLVGNGIYLGSAKGSEGRSSLLKAENSCAPWMKLRQGVARAVQCPEWVLLTVEEERRGSR